MTGRRMGDWEKTERLRGGRKACDVKEGGRGEEGLVIAARMTCNGRKDEFGGWEERDCDQCNPLSAYNIFRN